MTQTEKFMIAFFVERQPVNAQFESWPLHITLLPWLHIEAGDLRRTVAETVSHHQPIRAVVGKIALFGPNQDIPVRLIESPELHALHQELYDQLGEALEDATFMGPEYRPHVTQGYEQLQEGAILEVSGLSVIRKAASGNVKDVLSEFELGLGNETAS